MNAMRTVIGVLLAAMFLSVHAAAQVPAATMEATAIPSRVILGEPAEVKVIIRWNGSVTLPLAPRPSDPSLWTEVQLPDGSTRSWQNGTMPAPLPRQEPYSVAADCPVEINAYFPPDATLCAAGRCRIRLRYAVSQEWHGYYRSQEFWKGEVTSNWTDLEITEPFGEDANIWKAFRAISAKGDCRQFYNWIITNSAKILSRYPTSTYAAYVIHGIMSGFMQWDPNDEKARGYFIGRLKTGSFLSNSYPDDTGKSKDGWRSMEGKEAADWWAKWYDIILKNHPDIWFADELRLKKAVDQIAMKNYQAGAADLEQLCSTAKPEVAARAKVYLDLIKQKGWIKE